MATIFTQAQLGLSDCSGLDYSEQEKEISNKSKDSKKIREWCTRKYVERLRQSPLRQNPT